jgi:hypothetical protein
VIQQSIESVIKIAVMLSNPSVAQNEIIAISSLFKGNEMKQFYLFLVLFAPII